MLIIVVSTILLSITLAMLGTLSLWKKYIYFADGLAHASLLTAVIGATINLPLSFVGLFMTLVFSLLIFKLKKFAGTNESIMIVANIMLAAALVITSLTPSKIDITNLLFGDLIAVDINDALMIFGLLIATLIFIYLYYKQIILIVLNTDLAQAHGIKVNKIEMIFLLILGLSVFAAIKIVGVMLVTTILLIPSMSARLIAKTPFQMLMMSVIISLVTSLLGLAGAFYLNMQIAPIVILIGAALYAIIYYIKI
jgi:zinc transport system permease protein